ncbi:hypothetical protein [Massilia sp. NR 4-1]|uniref:hypothetical protein n=1 Tax=Massilia sp. NR 4-1 TaxID=1678028 RepID=UPI00067BB583|nr:hypothetical protein [Massilia sp. NR 4-1]AKU24383.1 hypothetical protein ACZ75_25920 [Massilia sp. NR 4-1]
MNSQKDKSSQNFVLVDTEHPEIGNVDLVGDVADLEVRPVNKPLPGNRQSTLNPGSRQGGEPPGSEGGAPGPDASSGV